MSVDAMAASGAATSSATSSDVPPSVAAASPVRDVGKMRSTIDDLLGGASLGETEVGKAWALKALHPSEQAIISSPMPVNETRSFATLAFNQMNTFSMPADFDPTKPWNLTLYIHRDPVILYSYKFSQSGKTDVNGYQYSTQVQQNANTSMLNELVALRTACERFRLTSHSVTAYFDGASDSDQGHVVCGQTELPRYTVPATQTPLPGNLGAHLPWTFYQDPVPTYDLILQTTRAYQGDAKDGVYCPSKLMALGTWTATNTVHALMGTSTQSSPSAPGSIPFGKLGQDYYYADQPPSDFYGTFPYCWTLQDGSVQRVFNQTDVSLTTIFFTGIAPTSSVRVTMRWTMDMIVRPGTTYSPFVRMPPVEDLSALKMYSEVSRRMADGYPSSYNNLGALLGVIGKIAATVGPMILPRLFDTIKNRVLENRKRGRVSMFESIMSLTPEQRARGNQLAAQEMRTPAEEQELADLQAHNTDIAPQVTAAANAITRSLASSRFRSSSYNRPYTRRFRSYGGTYLRSRSSYYKARAGRRYGGRLTRRSSYRRYY